VTDGISCDAYSRLWIQTDISESVHNQGPFAVFGNNQMLAADPKTGEIRRFLTGPKGREITGVITTPDQTTMFINVQHPGAPTSKEDFAAVKLLSHWPDGGDAVPRSATVVITREDRGKIGAQCARCRAVPDQNGPGHDWPGLQRPRSRTHSLRCPGDFWNWPWLL
jgi:secreted PhoX family phosphatase